MLCEMLLVMFVNCYNLKKKILGCGEMVKLAKKFISSYKDIICNNVFPLFISVKKFLVIIKDTCVS